MGSSRYPPVKQALSSEVDKVEHAGPFSGKFYMQPSRSNSIIRGPTAPENPQMHNIHIPNEGITPYDSIGDRDMDAAKRLHMDCSRNSIREVSICQKSPSTAWDESAGPC